MTVVICMEEKQKPEEPSFDPHRSFMRTKGVALGDFSLLGHTMYSVLFLHPDNPVSDLGPPALGVCL